MAKSHTLLNKRYRVVKAIGRGGTAETFLAKDTHSGKEVVCKLLKLVQVSDWKSLELFKREAGILKALDHPLIPDYIDNFQTELGVEKSYVLVQEFIKGETLDALIKQGRRFSLPEVRTILKTLLEILDYIHNMHPSVIHRDINPKNVILGEDGQPYLVDFGAVGCLRRDTQSAARSDTFVGTIGFMPQEQLYGKTLPASDLYALGMTIVFLVTGDDPANLEFNGARLDFRKKANLPDDLALLLERMTEPDFRKRPQTARGALDFLEGKVKVPRLPQKYPTGRIKIREEGGKTIIDLPNTAAGWTMLLGLGISIIGIISFSGVMQFCEMMDTGNTVSFIEFLSMAYPYYIAGILPVIYRLFFRTRRQLTLLPGKLTLQTTWLLLIKRVREFTVGEYEGFEAFGNWRINKVQAYKCRLHAAKKKYLLGHNYYEHEVDVLKKTIEGHIARNLIR